VADTSQEPDAERYLKVSEVAEMFSVQPATIREWLSEGRLRGIKIGNGHYWRIPLSAAKELANTKYGEK
jgi:excisionase family DNA binding protein